MLRESYGNFSDLCRFGLEYVHFFCEKFHESGARGVILRSLTLRVFIYQPPNVVQNARVCCNIRSCCGLKLLETADG